MNTKSQKNQSIKDAFEDIFRFDSEEDKLEHDKKILSARFLSEIQKFADAKKLNRKELAASVGTSASYITQLFNGDKSLNIDILVKFQDTLNLYFEVKANSRDISYANNESDEIFNYLLENSKEGFWAFHTNKLKTNAILEEKPDYNQILKIA